MIERLFDILAGEMQTLFRNGHLLEDWPIDGRDNQQRWVHAMICGALAKCSPEDCIPMIEPTLAESFRPDIVYLNQRNEKVAVIEYESTNSSDERLMAKDFTHFEMAIAEYRDWKSHLHEPSWVLPKLWLIISTLPKRPVHHWPWHGYNSLTRYPPYVKDRDLRNANPYAYYERALSDWSMKAWKSIEKSVADAASLTQVVWANIDGLTISVETVNGVRVNDGYSVPLRR